MMKSQILVTSYESQSIKKKPHLSLVNRSEWRNPQSPGDLHTFPLAAPISSSLLAQSSPGKSGRQHETTQVQRSELRITTAPSLFHE